MTDYDRILGRDTATILDDVGRRGDGRDPLRLRGMAGRAQDAVKKQSALSAKLAKHRQKSGGGKAAVQGSMEFLRIFDLPRRVLDFDIVEDVTHIFQKPGSTMTLKPWQSAALIEAALTNGLFAQIAAGFGKTLITLLLPTAMDSQHTVLFVPSQVRDQLLREIDTLYGKHFELPLDRLTITAPETLQQPRNAEMLDELHAERPIDLFVLDEAHMFRNKDATRTKRYLRFARDWPAIRHAALSGTMATRSLLDYAHLIELCLRKMSPLPRGYHELIQWSGAIDVDPAQPHQPGVLKKLCQEGEGVRDGYRRRRNETQGVIATTENEVGCSLIIRRLEITVPPSVEARLEEVRNAWSIDGNTFDSITTKVAYLKQVSCGFYYRWVWPNGEPDYEWLAARSAWHTALRDRLKHASKGMDSDFLLAAAAERWLKGQRDGKVWNCPAWADWKLVKDRKPPPTETVWIDKFLVKDAIARARAHVKKTKVPTILWYEHSALGEALGALSGLPVYGAGMDASPTRFDILIASIGTQSVGKNLQHHYGHNIVLELPPNGARVEQLLARTHRDGQRFDEVACEWYGHTPETRSAIYKAIEDAKFREEEGDGRQRLLYATRIDD